MTRAARQKLITDHMPLARKIAMTIGRKAPPWEWDDINAAALEGLVIAAHSFKPARGALFGSFASHRIRGAILDYQRSQDPLARSHREKVKEGRSVSVTTLHGENAEEVLEHIAAPGAPHDERVDIWRTFERGLRLLPPREAAAIVAYFVYGVTGREIGAALGISESRCCQLRTDAKAVMALVAEEFLFRRAP